MAYQEVEKQMMDAYQALRAKYPSAQLVVSGHSLGAAVATHALVHLRKVFISLYEKSGINVNEFITFGSPRVGDAKFSAWLK